MLKPTSVPNRYSTSNAGKDSRISREGCSARDITAKSFTSPAVGGPRTIVKLGPDCMRCTIPHMMIPNSID